MKIHGRFFLTALLAAIGLLAAGGASPQPRQPSNVEYVRVPTPDDEVWLRRLVGNFTLDGQVGYCSPDGQPTCSAIKGKMNCIAVGNGPGVQCIINATWLYALNPYLDPAMALFGVDRGKSKLSFLLVNDTGAATDELGTIKGHFGTFRICFRDTGAGCERHVVIEAKPDANLNYMWIGEAMVIAMRRVRTEDTMPPKGSR